MIEAVAVFGLLNVLFEITLLTMLSPRWRLRVLGSETACGVLHIAFLLINLVVHYGTLIGSMASILAFISSIATVALCRRIFGYVRGDVYQPGVLRYAARELI